MPTTSEKPSSASKKAIQAGAFGLSALIHLCLLFLVGGAVIIQGVILKPSMVADVPPADEIAPVEDTPPPDDPTPSPDETTSDMPPPATSEVAIQADPITVEAVTAAPTFNMSVATPGTTSDAFNPSTGASESATPSPAGKRPLRNMGSLFGTPGEATDGLVGYFYDLKQDNKKKPFSKPYTMDIWVNTVLEFIKKDWDEKVLEPFYKSKKPLTAYQICLPMMDASDAPKAFGVEKDVEPRGLIIHYKGTFIAPKSGTFRFVGTGDDMLFVRFNKKTVFQVGAYYTPTPEQTIPGVNLIRLYSGDWFHMSKGESYPLEVLIGECPGGFFYAFMMIEDKSEKYKTDPNLNLPILPLFQTVATKIPKYPVYDPAKEKNQDPILQLKNPHVLDEGFVAEEPRTPSQ